VKKHRRVRRPTGFGSNIVSVAASAGSRPIAYDEPRGHVLLFTGVRYEYARTTTWEPVLQLSDLSTSRGSAHPSQ
jgi:hypothetical protein